MKLIKHIIFIDCDENEMLMLNSLNGLMDKISYETYETLLKWQKCENIFPEGNFEQTLHNILKNRGYLVHGHDEESAIKNELIKKLRMNHAKQKVTRKHLTFVMTYDCNFRCQYCFEGENHIKKDVITPTQVDAALKFAGKELESIGLFGGEPLLPSTMSSLMYLTSKAADKTYNITTNGYYLLEFFDVLSKVKVSDVMVTLDGDEKTHDSRRFLANGEPTYQKIMIGIQKYIENGIPICIRINVDKSNLEEIKKLRETLLVKFNEYRNLLTFEIQSLFGTSYDEKTKIVDALYASDIEHSPEERLRRNRMMGKFSPLINAVTINSPMKPVYSFCQAHHNSLLLDPYGDLYPCMPAVGTEELAVGTYYPDIRFKENSIYNRNIESIPECRECIYSLLCGGGCPLALQSYEDVLKPVCFCVHEQIHNTLPGFYKKKTEAAHRI